MSRSSRYRRRSAWCRSGGSSAPAASATWPGRAPSRGSCRARNLPRCRWPAGSKIRSLKAAMKLVPPAAQRCFIDPPAFLAPTASSAELIIRVVQNAGAHHAAPSRAVPDSRTSTTARTRPVIGPLRDGMLKFGVRWNTKSCAACCGDHRDRLDRRGPGADHADAHAGKIDAFMRPMPGVVGLAAKLLDAREVRHSARWTGSRSP